MDTHSVQTGKIRRPDGTYVPVIQAGRFGESLVTSL